MSTILFTGDNLAELKTLAQSISKAGFGIFICAPHEFLETITKQKPDIVVCDGRLDVITEIAEPLSPRERIPLLAIVDLDSISLLDRSRNIDDFIIRPINEEELLHRVRRLLWKSNKFEGGKIIKIGDLVINLESYQVYAERELISLTLKEFELLKFLVTHRGKVYTREFLLNQIWDYDYYVFFFGFTVLEFF